jgi:hypothetical protein
MVRAPAAGTGPERRRGLERGRARTSPITMKIARVTATPLNVPLHIKLVGVDRATSLACCHVEVETPARVRVNNYRFPGWTARVDGVAVPLVDVP